MVEVQSKSAEAATIIDNDRGAAMNPSSSDADLRMIVLIVAPFKFGYYRLSYHVTCLEGRTGPAMIFWRRDLPD